MEDAVLVGVLQPFCGVDEDVLDLRHGERRAPGEVLQRRALDELHGDIRDAVLALEAVVDRDDVGIWYRSSGFFANALSVIGSHSRLTLRAAPAVEAMSGAF